LGNADLDTSEFHLTTNTVKPLSIVSKGPGETERERGGERGKGERNNINNNE
jgi:hypothetical protein